MRFPDPLHPVSRGHITRLSGIVPLIAFACLAIGSRAAESQPHGDRPADVRLGALKDLNGYFPFLVPPTMERWEERATMLRRQLLVSQGLWPMPTKEPLNAVIHGRIELDGYSVEKVYFESMPGFFVTGNLYRPGGKEKKRPGVLCPHGHWANGRFYDCGEKAIREQIVQGAERFGDSGRSPMQSRCVGLARMGCVVFHWDMIGYADSQQISAEIIHRFAKQRPEMNAVTRWGLFSPQAESRLQSAMGLQTFNSIRALDFLSSLPDVDPNRIAVTGASGGGTQTFLLAAIDPRPSVAFPAVMVSTAMQGGCTCENACCLRTETGNIEIAALFAPKPLGLTAADDWTVEMAAKGFPELAKLYALAGVPNQVMLKPLVHFKHNYNNVSRAAMYSWFNKHLHLGLPEPIVEEEYRRLTETEMTVWDENHPRPLGGPEFERQLLQWWDADANQQLKALLASDASGWKRYREVVAGGVDAIIGRRLPDPSRLAFRADDRKNAGYTQLQGLLTCRLEAREALAATGDPHHPDAKEQLPVIVLRPKLATNRSCFLVFANGKEGLFEAGAIPTKTVRRLLDSGVTVCSADLLFQGEFLEPGQTVDRSRRVSNEREAAAYTFGYNRSLFAQRVHDILSVVAMLKKEPFLSTEIDLVGLQGAGPWVAAAQAQAGAAVARCAIDTGGFRFANVHDLHDPSFLPGGAKYDDLPGMLALGAPRPLWLTGEGTALPELVAAAYAAERKKGVLALYAGPPADAGDNAVSWLLK